VTLRLGVIHAAPTPSWTLSAWASSSAILSAREYALSAGSSCFRIASAASRRRPALRSHAAGLPRFEQLLGKFLRIVGHRVTHMLNEMVTVLRLTKSPRG
jgi:hypothetical protein